MSRPDVEASLGALLVVVPSASNGGPAISPATVVAGLPLITRIIRAAKASGYADVLVCDMEAGLRRLIEGAGAAVLTPARRADDCRRRRIVVIPANVVPESRWLRSLLNEPIESERLYVDGASVVLVETARSGAVIAAAAGSASAPALVSALSRVFDKGPEPLTRHGRFPLSSAAEVATAETWLLQSLIKENEGFMSRHFERRISLAITRRLAPTAVTPDMMTLTSLVVGLAGAPFFLSASATLQLTGALLFLAHSILDGCDGELARLKFLTSRRGAILDFWGDNVVHVAVFVCIAIGWTLHAGTAWPLVLGAIAAVGTLGSAALMFERTAADRPESADSPATARLTAALASRDFIYLLILCSAFGKAFWFLIAAAVGTPAFFLVVLWNERHRGRVR
jgi:1L-myo-inositol 1-phosphate cytidylyltransferase / CDP-L-myo-inositol myo-inositolphosphotransferase